MKNINLIIVLGFILAGCSQENDHHTCYDSSLVHENVCTADCPGFEGCDGNTYCNQCVAARLGIGPK